MKNKSNIFTIGMVVVLLVLIVPVLSYAITRKVGQGQQYQTIQAAIDASSNGDIVLIYDGTYYEYDIDFDGRAIEVKSVSGRDNTIVDCEKKGRGFIFQSSEGENSLLSGVTIRNAKTNGRGGGILCKKTSSPTLKNLKIESCFAMMGGGICAEYSSLIIDNSIIEGCGATRQHGGGIAIYGAGSKKYLIRNCSIKMNKARGIGGGIYTAGAKKSIEIKGTSINRNSAKRGGGIYINGDVVWMTGCIINSNVAHENSGGGAYINNGSNVIMEEVYIEKNQAKCAGGGIYSYGHPSSKASIVFLKGRIAQNKLQSGAGGGVALKGAIAHFGTTIFFENTHYAIAIYAALTTPPLVSSDCQFIGNTPSDFNY